MQPRSSGSRLLRVSEAADRLGLAPRSVWDLLARGVIPRVRLGRRATRIAEADLEKFIAKARGEAKGEQS